MVDRLIHNHNHEHKHGDGQVSRTRIWLAIGVTGLFMLVEIVGGIITNSLALISDAAHMFTHAFALTLTLLALIWSARSATPIVSYGFHRTEILAALINGLLLLAVTAYIMYEAVMRFISPMSVDAGDMFWVALSGLGANLISAALLSGGQKGNLNVRSAFLHMFTDMISSVAIVIGAIAIWFWDLNWLDPVLSLVLSLLIVRWSWGLLSQSIRVLMEAAPLKFDFDEMIEAVALKFPTIKRLHDIHVWSVQENQPILTAHVVTTTVHMRECTREMKEIQQFLKEEFQITHSVLQMEYDSGDADTCSLELEE